jgi:hypothetical protein
MSTSKYAGVEMETLEEPGWYAETYDPSDINSNVTRIMPREANGDDLLIISYTPSHKATTAQRF